MNCKFNKKLNCYIYRFLGNEELKKLYDYLEIWQKSNKIFRKDLSMYYNPEIFNSVYVHDGFLRIVGEKHYYRIYLDKENFLKVAKIVKKGFNNENV